MNKKVFIGATLVTATVVGGLVYYRHVLLEQVGKTLEQLDRWLDHEELKEDPDAEPVSVVGPDDARIHAIREQLEAAINGPHLSGAEMHAKYPHMFDESGRPIRKEEPGV